MYPLANGEEARRRRSGNRRGNEIASKALVGEGEDEGEVVGTTGAIAVVVEDGGRHGSLIGNRKLFTGELAMEP